MDQSWLTIFATLMKAMNTGTDHSAIREMIQQELRRSQNQENSDALRQMLTVIEQKHAAELQEASRERDMYKMQAEFLNKQVQELNREKRSSEKSGKMKELLTHMAQLNVQNVQSQPKPAHYKHKQNSYSSQPCSSQDSSRGGTLPWLDNSKTNLQSPQYRHGQHAKDFQKNVHSDVSSKQNFQHNNSNLHHNQVQDSNQNFQQKHHYQQSQRGQPSNRYRSHHYQQSQRGQPSNRYRGRGQRGASNRGRSASVDRNSAHNKAQFNNADGASSSSSTSFHVHVTKVGGQWVSSENISAEPKFNSQRGRGNARGRGRGRGRGQGISQQGVPGEQYNVKKNRKKHPQNQHEGHQNHDPRRKEVNNEADPEDNCILS